MLKEIILILNDLELFMEMIPLYSQIMSINHIN